VEKVVEYLDLYYDSGSMYAVRIQPSVRFRTPASYAGQSGGSANVTCSFKLLTSSRHDVRILCFERSILRSSIAGDLVLLLG
jgi:hypothetical protein